MNKEMKISIARTSGFCFGVNRAVKIVHDLLSSGKKVCTLGPIIHNPTVIENFKNMGVKIVEEPSLVPDDTVLVIRSHGVTKSILEYIRLKNIKYIDTTCPFVKKIHNIVIKFSDKNSLLLAAGDKNHPEMIGIISYFNGTSYVFKNFHELEEILKKISNKNYNDIIVISQTTFSIEEWEKCTLFLKNTFTNIKIFDTICNTTNSRQKEAEFLSKNSNLVVVIGGKQSSNTRKLYEICSTYTRTVWIENVDELVESIFYNCETISIVAGASTPTDLVSEVYNHIKRMVNYTDYFKGRSDKNG